jgi:hypothetical protein
MVLRCIILAAWLLGVATLATGAVRTHWCCPRLPGLCSGGLELLGRPLGRRGTATPRDFGLACRRRLLCPLASLRLLLATPHWLHR